RFAPAVAIPRAHIGLAGQLHHKQRIGQSGQGVATDELAPAAEAPATVGGFQLHFRAALPRIGDDRFAMPSGALAIAWCPWCDHIPSLHVAALRSCRQSVIPEARTQGFGEKPHPFLHFLRMMDGQVRPFGSMLRAMSSSMISVL
ncbi:hypothetical protein CUR49_03465, partial [Enterococcus faecalis]